MPKLIQWVTFPYLTMTYNECAPEGGLWSYILLTVNSCWEIGNSIYQILSAQPYKSTQHNLTKHKNNYNIYILLLKTIFNLNSLADTLLHPYFINERRNIIRYVFISKHTLYCVYDSFTSYKTYKKTMRIAKHVWTLF